MESIRKTYYEYENINDLNLSTQKRSDWVQGLWGTLIFYTILFNGIRFFYILFTVWTDNFFEHIFIVMNTPINYVFAFLIVAGIPLLINLYNKSEAYKGTLSNYENDIIYLSKKLLFSKYKRLDMNLINSQSKEYDDNMTINTNNGTLTFFYKWDYLESTYYSNFSSIYNLITEFAESQTTEKWSKSDFLKVTLEDRALLEINLLDIEKLEKILFPEDTPWNYLFDDDDALWSLDDDLADKEIRELWSREQSGLIRLFNIDFDYPPEYCLRIKIKSGTIDKFIYTSLDFEKLIASSFKQNNQNRKVIDSPKSKLSSKLKVD